MLNVANPLNENNLHIPAPEDNLDNQNSSHFNTSRNLNSRFIINLNDSRV